MFHRNILEGEARILEARKISKVGYFSLYWPVYVPGSPLSPPHHITTLSVYASSLQN